MPRITDLPAVSSLTGGETLPVVQTGTAKSITLNDIVVLIAAQLSNLTESHIQFYSDIDGFVWIVNGGAPVLGVTRIYINGILQDINDFAITVATGTIISNADVSATATGHDRIDIYFLV
jgi:hypothetical protein